MPVFDYKIKKEKQGFSIFDVVRKKYIYLYPEEWVRQHFIHFLLANSYPKSLIRVESGHQYNKLQKRTDIITYQKNGKPFLLVECKATSCPINELVFAQVSTYNLTLKAPYLALSNGLETFFYAFNFKTKQYLRLNKLPKFEKESKF